MCLDTIFSSITADDVTAAATVAIAVASCLALRSWEKEKKYDLAEEIVLLSHEVKDRLGQVRFQHIMAGEIPASNKNVQEDEERLRIFSKRLNDNLTTFNRLYFVERKASLRFKKEGVDKKLKELITIIREVQIAAGTLAEGIQAGINVSQDNTLQECKKAILAYGKDDKIADEVNCIVKEIEKKLEHYYG